MIDTMNPTPAQPPVTHPPASPQPTGGISFAPEREGPVIALQESGLKDIGHQEIDLPKEVSAVGVSVHPTTVTLPQPVTQAGVQVVGQSVVPTPTHTSVPLTDDLIRQGESQPVTSSWRWLAEWCVRKMKQLHTLAKSSSSS